jgi:hypothetical protein
VCNDLHRTRTARKCNVRTKRHSAHSAHASAVHGPDYLLLPVSPSPPRQRICDQPQPHRVRGKNQQACTAAFIVDRVQTSTSVERSLHCCPNIVEVTTPLSAASSLADVPSSHDFPPGGCLTCLPRRAGPTDSSAVRPLRDNTITLLSHSYLRHH